MADEKKDDKKLSAQEIAHHAEALYKREWDAERNAIRNPNMVFLGLLAYVRLTATRLHETEEKLKKDGDELVGVLYRLEKRVAEFETRLTTIERWKVDAELQGQEMMKGVEELMTGGVSPIDRLKELLGGTKEEPPHAALPAAKVTIAETAPIDVSKGAKAVITPIKPDKPNKKSEDQERDEKKGGAA